MYPITWEGWIIVGRSCGKSVLVNACPEDRPEQTLRMYVMINDQSNRTLAVVVNRL